MSLRLPDFVLPLNRYKETDGERHWLTPNGNVYFNIFQTQSLRYLFRVEGENFNDFSEFILIKPSRVILQPNGREWKLEKKGILHLGKTVVTSDISSSNEVNEQSENGSSVVVNDLFTLLEKTEQENKKISQQNQQLLTKYGTHYDKQVQKFNNALKNLDFKINKINHKINNLESRKIKSNSSTKTLVGLGTAFALGAATILYLNNRQINPFNTNIKASTNFVQQAIAYANPAVVRVDIEKTVPQQEDFSSNSFFEEFIGENKKTQQRKELENRGSGFISDNTGIIWTNASVVGGENRVIITLQDGRKFEGEVTGTDELTDLAVIKIDPQGVDLPTVPLGDSSQVKVGDWAIAIGNPSGLDNTVSVGIISAIGRSSSQIGIPDKRIQFIQTDAAINPGNFGGPLLNSRGEVIGINAAIRADTQGLSFAIPIKIARHIAEQLFTKGKAEHPYIGVSMINLSPETKESISNQQEFDFEITEEQGALVVEVISNSPAEQAGFEKGDTIIKIRDRPIENSLQVQEEVAVSEIGESLKVKIVRNGKTKIIEVRPAIFPESKLNN